MMNRKKGLIRLWLLNESTGELKPTRHTYTRAFAGKLLGLFNCGHGTAEPPHTLLRYEPERFRLLEISLDPQRN